MKIAILGYGSQGQAALEYWNTPDNQLTVCDQDAGLQLPAGVGSQLGSNYLHDLDQFDLLVRTPRLHPNDITLANPDAPNILAKVTTVTNEFFRVCPSKNIIGVTGTKGKGTTSTLIAKILETAGQRVHLGGNIGIPPLELLKSGIQPSNWVVLELANFQLIDLEFSPPVAVCLAVEPEHLDWHADMDEYLTAKQQLFLHQTADDLAVYNRRNQQSEQVASGSKGAKLSYEVPDAGAEPQQTTGAYVRGDTIYMDDAAVCQVDDVALPGRHNLQNVCAAIAATWDVIGQDTDVITKVVQTLKSLPHRLELVRTVDEVAYYDDSFAAAPGAAVAALEAITQPKVMIIGGFDRQLDLDELATAVKTHQPDIRSVLLVGGAAARLGEALQSKGFTDFTVTDVKTMPEIVAQARQAAQPGDAVVLSPGFPSFDMFKNFEERGNLFHQSVEAL